MIISPFVGQTVKLDEVRLTSGEFNVAFYRLDIIHRDNKQLGD
jgi:hypothetical protein